MAGSRDWSGAGGPCGRRGEARRRPGAIFLEGDPAYYGRLGWRPASELGVTPPSAQTPTPACQAVLVARVATLDARNACLRGHVLGVGLVGLRGDRLARAQCKPGG